MRATLFHNPTAGAEDYSAEVLLRLLRGHGIEAGYQSTRKQGWATAIEDPGDLVIVAGGDGSIAKVAKGLSDRDIPLAILPTGTANNIARSLGIVGTPQQLIAAWDLDRTRPLDIGVAEGPWGKRRFIESVGLGAFATAIALAESAAVPDGCATRNEALARGRSILLAALAASRVQHCVIHLDGAPRQLRYLMFEAMSTSHFGPAVHLAPGADPGDGRFDAVVVDEQWLGGIQQYLSRPAEDEKRLPIPAATRVTEVAFEWDGQPLHVDDEVFAGLRNGAAGGVAPVTLRIRESVQVLASER